MAYKLHACPDLKNYAYNFPRPSSISARLSMSTANSFVKITSPEDSFLHGNSEMANLIRSHDWSNTPLGPIDTWPQSLRTTVSLCLASNFPIDIIWGSEHTQIYNDGYRIVCGDKHPAALGMDYKECWASG
jgi:hypothetical protein